MIGDNYLHVQRWCHNLAADSAKILSLPVWVHFPWLPIEYYTEEWLQMAGDMIGRTIKIDNTTLATARGRFARVCVKLELEKPVKASFGMRAREWKIEYKCLQDICFACGKYGHKEIKCHLATHKGTEAAEGNERDEASSHTAQPTQKE